MGMSVFIGLPPLSASDARGKVCAQFKGVHVCGFLLCNGGVCFMFLIIREQGLYVWMETALLLWMLDAWQLKQVGNAWSDGLCRSSMKLSA